MKFTQTHKDWNGEFLETVSIETKDDLQIDDALETFGRFLKAAGYYFDGEITIVNSEQDDDQFEDDLDWNTDEELDEDTETEDTISPRFEGPVVGFQDSYEDPQLVSKSPWPFPVATKP